MQPSRLPDEARPRIEERAAQPYLAIRRQVRTGVPAAVDGQFPALFAWLGERLIEPSGPPFIRTLAVDPSGEPLELELGLPVASEVDGDGAVRAGFLPAGRYLTLVHVGPYRSADRPDLGDARDALVRSAAEREIAYGRPSGRGRELACCVEHLRVGPEETGDHERWETEIAYLIVGE